MYEIGKRVEEYDENCFTALIIQDHKIAENYVILKGKKVLLLDEAFATI